MEAWFTGHQQSYVSIWESRYAVVPNGNILSRCTQYRGNQFIGARGKRQMQIQLPEGKFKCIVADPPWDHSDGTGFSFGFRDPRGRSGKHGASSHSLPYSVMALADIKALPVLECADKDAVLYLWTTSRFLEAAHDVAREWGFKPGTVLVWCKPPNQGLFGGTFLSNVEFVVTAKRGNPKATGKIGSRWFTWPRRKHSEKPHEFQTMVETISPAPRLELFARRNLTGWTCWGNEIEDARAGQGECPGTACNSASPKAAHVTMELGL